MIDPLADPRAEDLLAAVPADVSMLAGAFHTAAHEAGMTATGLLAAREDGTWTGHAADSFRESIGHIPGELERVRTGYQAVATALSDYETALALVQSEFVRVVGSLSDVRARIGTAETIATTAQGSMTPGHPLTYDDLLAAELAIAQAKHTLEGYHAQRRALQARALTLLDDFDSARRLCRATVAAAQRTAPVSPQAGQGKHAVAPGGRLSRAEGAVWQMSPVGGSGAGWGAGEHVIIDLNGRFYESGGGSASGGAPFVHQFSPSASYLASFNTLLHPAGL